MEQKIGRILAVDDNEDILFALKLLLRPHVEIIETLTGPERIPEIMQKQDWDVVLLDMNFTKDAISGQEGFDALSQILEIDDLKKARERFERIYILRKLRENSWNISLTAKKLGITRQQLHKKIEKLGLRRRQEDNV